MREDVHVANVKLGEDSVTVEPSTLTARIPQGRPQLFKLAEEDVVEAQSLGDGHACRAGEEEGGGGRGVGTTPNHMRDLELWGLLAACTCIDAAASVTAHIDFLQANNIGVQAAQLLDDAWQLVAPLNVPLQELDSRWDQRRIGCVAGAEVRPEHVPWGRQAHLWK